MNLSTLELFHAPIRNNNLTNSIAYVVLNTVLDDARVLKTAYFGRKFGARAVVYGITASPDSDRCEINGIEVSRVANPRYSLSAQAWPRDPEERDMHRFCHIAAQRIGAQILEQRPMLLHTHDMYGIYVGAYCQSLLASQGLFIPWIHDVHEYSDGLTMLPKSFQALAVEYERDYIRQPDQLLTVSPPIANILTEKFALGAVPTIILNCPSKVRSGTADLRSALGLGDDKQIVVYSGGLTRERGTHTLVEALKFLPSSVVLAFVASDRGGMIASLTSLAESFGVADRVYFRPYVPNAEVTSFLRTADLGCHPMIHFPNGEVALPNKVFEYLHAGLPLVVSDVAQMKEFVETTQTGAVFEAENPEDLARAIADTLRDRETIRARVTPAFLDRYCWESEEAKLDRIYRDLLQPHPSGAERRAAARRALTARAGDAAASASAGLDPLRGLRIFHGPGQGAGQPLAIANAERKLGLSANHVLINPPEGGISYPAHRTLIANRLWDHPHWRLAARILRDYDILHLYSRPLIRISPEHRFPSGADLMVARALGIPIIMDLLGSEIRLEDEFRRKNRFHWLDGDDGGRAAVEAGKRRFISLSRGIANRMVALDAEVQSYVPDAVIIERAVDLDEWRYVGPSRTERPLVVHAPSNRLFKGTEFVLQAVEELKNEGEEFDFQLIENVPNATARDMLASADIVIDQLRIGWYGVLACEAMALGKPVVVYIRPDLLDYFTAHGCPFILADPTSVKDALRALIRDPQARQAAGVAGRSFVTRVHDARVIAGKFAAMYGEVLQEEEIADIGALLEWYWAYEGEFTKTRAEASEGRAKLEVLESAQQELDQLKADMQRVSANARRAVATRDQATRELEETKVALADALKRANEAEVLRARAEAAAAEVAAETASLRARIGMPDRPASQAAAATGAGEPAPSATGRSRSRRLPWSNRPKAEHVNGEAKGLPASLKSMPFGIGPEALMASLQGRRGDLLSPLLASLGLDRQSAICVAGANVQQQEAFSSLVGAFPNIDVRVTPGDKSQAPQDLPATVRVVSEIPEDTYDLIVMMPSLVTIGQWMKEELPGWVGRGLKPDGVAVTYFVRLHAFDAIKDKVPAPLLEFVQSEFAASSDVRDLSLPSFLASQYSFIANVDRRIGTTAYLSWLALRKAAAA